MTTTIVKLEKIESITKVRQGILTSRLGRGKSKIDNVNDRDHNFHLEGSA
jgi:hypothetical protein